MHTETTHSSGYWLGTVLLLYLHRPATDRVADIVTTQDTTIQYTDLVSTHMTYFSLVSAVPNDHVLAWWAGNDLYVTEEQYYCRAVRCLSIRMHQPG